MLTLSRLLALIVIVQFQSISYANVLFTCYESNKRPAFEFSLATEPKETSYLQLFNGPSADRKLMIRKLESGEKTLEFTNDMTEFATLTLPSYRIGIFNVDLRKRRQLMSKNNLTSVYMQIKGTPLNQYTYCVF